MKNLPPIAAIAGLILSIILLGMDWNTWPAILFGWSLAGCKIWWDATRARRLRLQGSCRTRPNLPSSTVSQMLAYKRRYERQHGHKLVPRFLIIGKEDYLRLRAETISFCKQSVGQKGEPDRFPDMLGGLQIIVVPDLAEPRVVSGPFDEATHA